ncbi:efflux RND transporter periplasmic adaptor subunit [Steroidobacter agaridevorans]|uniref:efflux RND transporter periplasmic adaptor subunit n=1 Tax=Steroidobacter agaridevorans TaxID=2695856 RepID=UPI00192A2720|nr:efflux RND transporter periplasmic adaptor subunit [Steroidobacter agaridevorans]
MQQLTLEESSREVKEPRRRHLSKGTLSLALIVVIASGTFTLWQRDLAVPQVETVAAVAATNPATQPVAVLEATGYVVARRQATVSTQITGTIIDVLMEEGESVAAGQVLTRLESSAQSAELSEAEAQVLVARSLLGLYEAQLVQAMRDLERKQSLAKAGAVSTQSMETAMTQVDMLRSQIDSQHRQVDLASAQVARARVQLNHTVVRAPFSGVVVAKTAQAGEIVSPMSAGGGFTRTGIGTIVDMDSLEIEVDVNEAYINRVRSDQPGQAVLDAYPQWSIPVHVIAIVPTADRSKATVKVRVAIEQKDPRILPDMGVRVSLHEPRENVSNADSATHRISSVLVPKSAIVDGEGNHWVFVEHDGRVRKSRVGVGSASGDLQEVTGVPAGSRVIRVPSANMSDGSRVAVTNE